MPPFLDTALQPARDKLQQAAKGGGHLDDVLNFRVMKDALKLQVMGGVQANGLRRIYPQGLSPQAAEEIMKNMRLALNRTTLQMRSLVALLGVIIGGGIFAGIFLTPIHARVTQGLKPALQAAVDGGLLMAVLVGFWFALSAATRFALQRRFPDFTIPLAQKTGRTGYMMLVGVMVAFVAIMLLAPEKPAWLANLLAMRH